MFAVRRIPGWEDIRICDIKARLQERGVTQKAFHAKGKMIANISIKNFLQGVAFGSRMCYNNKEIVIQTRRGFVWAYGSILMS